MIDHDQKPTNDLWVAFEITNTWDGMKMRWISHLFDEAAAMGQGGWTNMPWWGNDHDVNLEVIIIWFRLLT